MYCDQTTAMACARAKGWPIGPRTLFGVGAPNGSEIGYWPNDQYLDEQTGILYVFLGTPGTTVGWLQVSDPVNVLAFGAVGDGVTDDTLAIQEAITAAGAYGSIYFPLGHYLVSSTLYYYSGQAFLGYAGGSQFSADQTSITMTGAGAQNLFEPFDTSIDNINVTWKNLRLQGNGTTGVVINLYRTSYSRIERCYVTLGVVGILLDANTINQCYFNTIFDSKVAYNIDVNFRFQRGANSNNIIAGWTGGATRSVEFFTASTSNVFNGTSFQGVFAPNATDIHVYSDGGVNKLMACWIEAANVGVEETANGRVEMIATTFGGGVTTKVQPNPTPGIVALRLHTVPVPGDVGFNGDLGSLNIVNNPTSINNTYTFTLPVRSVAALGQIVWNITGTGAQPSNVVFQKDGTTQLILDLLNGDFEANQNTGHFTVADDVRFGRDSADTGIFQVNLGGSWQSALKFDGTIAAGSTRLLVYDVDSGLVQRVKAGANGTGPGGVGRALYIDNV